MSIISGPDSPVMQSNFCTFSPKLVTVFEQAIFDYHVFDSPDQMPPNPFIDVQPDHQLYSKCWIDTVQWHLEDEVRRPGIVAGDGLELKRRIDRLNQERTKIVESIDDYFLDTFRLVNVSPEARINTESPAWAVDRLSILLLKIYHMKLELARTAAPAGHAEQCEGKLKLLYEQKADLCLSIDELLQDIAWGRKRMKVYRQVKMYNDPQLNPVLYKSSEKQATL
jgi:hypothetical protein